VFGVSVCVYSWEGSGVNEVGKDKATGAVRIKINPRYYRPTEVVRVPDLFYSVNLLPVLTDVTVAWPVH